jgi:hypothetical protein
MSYHAAKFGGNVINTTADMGSRTSVAFSMPDPVYTVGSHLRPICGQFGATGVTHAISVNPSVIDYNAFHWRLFPTLLD